MTDDLSIPAILRLTPAQRKAAWEDHPPVHSFALIQTDPRQQELRESQRKARVERSMAKLKQSLAKKNRRDAMPADWNPRDFRWDPRQSRWVRDEFAHLCLPAHRASGLIDSGSPPTESRMPAAPKVVDDLRIKLLDYGQMQQLKTFALANGVWDDKYAQLPNVGLVRMNVINRLRAKVRKGHVVEWTK